MSITKRLLKSKPVCKVTFKHFPIAADDVGSVHLVGDFNQWETAATPMKKGKGGMFSVTLDLPAESSHQFRYLVNGTLWENDAAADRYVWSEYAGTDNSVVDV